MNDCSAVQEAEHKLLMTDHANVFDFKTQRPGQQTLNLHPGRDDVDQPQRSAFRAARRPKRQRVPRLPSCEPVKLWD